MNTNTIVHTIYELKKWIEKFWSYIYIYCQRILNKQQVIFRNIQIYISFLNMIKSYSLNFANKTFTHTHTHTYSTKRKHFSLLKYLYLFLFFSIILYKIQYIYIDYLKKYNIFLLQ